MEIFCPVARLTTKYSAGHVSMNSRTRNLAPSSVPTQAQRFVPSASTLKMSNGRSICLRKYAGTNLLRRRNLSPAKAKESLPTIATSIWREHKHQYESVFQQAFTRISEH